MTRRGWLQGMLAAGLWPALAGRGEAAQPQVKDMQGIQELQKNWKTHLAENFKAPLPTEPLKLSKEEWRKRLPPQAYTVLRDEAPSAPAPAPSTTRSVKASMPAPAVTCRCSPPR